MCIRDRCCGSQCHTDSGSTEVITAQASAPVPSQVQGQGAITVQTVLNNRWAVIGIVAILGPLGLPAVWFCPRFSSTTKILITALYLFLTAVIPVAVAYWILADSFNPLVEAFGPQAAK